MKLFIPESWDTEAPDCVERRTKTKMPEDAHYRPKWRIALELVDKVVTHFFIPMKNVGKRLWMNLPDCTAIMRHDHWKVLYLN